jgi:acyl-CoA thioesterase-2
VIPLQDHGAEARDIFAKFVRTLNVERLEDDQFVGASDRDEGRLFGGLVLAQAGIAAGRTVDPDRRMHSLHAYFLRAGSPDIPIGYNVERVRDGRTFTSRRVLVRQAGKAICDVTASYARHEEGMSHQEPMPAMPPPDSLPDARFAFPADDGTPWPIGPIEWRFTQHPDRVAPPGEPPVDLAWMRLRGHLPDDPVLHTAALLFASDAGSFAGIERRYGWSNISHKASASLDHAFWLHHDVRWYGWLLMVTFTPVAHSARALTYRSIFTEDGTHLASVAQEAVVRRERTTESA